MGVFLFSNKRIDAEKVERVFSSRGHKRIASETSNAYTLVHANKVLIDNGNFLKGNELEGGGNDDFALGIGTYFYDGSYGIDALRKVYNNLEAVLKDNPVYGQWAFVIRKNKTTYIFNDMSGFMRLFYVVDNDGIIVSSSIVSVISLLEQPIFDRKRLGGFIASFYCKEIPFVEGVETVDSLKYLKIEDGKSSEWIERDIPEVPRIETLEEATKYVKGLFKDQMNQLKAIGDEKISIELTGGLDSRLIASNLKTSGFNYDFVQYPIFGPDHEIADIISKGLGKRLLIQTNQRSDDFNKNIGEFDYGYNYFRQYCNPRWKTENRFQFSGARGECIDLPDIYTDEDLSNMDDPRLEVLLPKLTIVPVMKDGYIAMYKEYLISKFEKLGFKRGELLSEREQSELSQILGGRINDSMYCSGAQAHLYFYQIFNEWHFNHFIHDIAFDAKKGRKLSIALIKDIDPEMGAFPVLSRRRTKRNSVNELESLPLQYKSYNKIKNMMPKWLVSFLYSKMGRTFSKERLSEIDFEYYKDCVKVDELKRYPNLYCDYLNRIYSLEVLRKAYGIK